MTLIQVKSYLSGEWIAPDSSAREIENAITGRPLGRAGNACLDMTAALAYGREIGGPALRQLTFHDRARMLKALALHLGTQKQALYDLSFMSGSTQKDHLIDIDGGIGTLFVFASKGRREMPDAHVYLDGGVEELSRNGTFKGQHICTPLQGVAVHINAFNFPVWGMLEKLAPTLLAGVPAIVKPATATSYITELAVKIILDSNILPEGVLQLVTGGTGDLLDQLTCQDVVSFTGSAQTALALRSRPHILENAIRFIAEQDSLNACVLAPDAVPDTPEFDLFIKEVQREMTTKAGQKCTAIRRIMVPKAQEEAVLAALAARLAQTRVGDPRIADIDMGALVSAAQKADVLAKAGILGREAALVIGDPENFTPEGDDVQEGAFVPPLVFHCQEPLTATRIHDTEVFGPVATVMGYEDIGEAALLLNKGQGSLVASVITHDPKVAQDMTMASAAYHGRLYFNDRISMNEATGHGAPLPHMIHGGPGRAGGGEEMGGVRGVKHFMQRTAVQGNPDILAAIGQKWVSGATERKGPAHPFTRTFHQLAIGETLHTQARRVTMDDIAHFATLTGDKFYAHMDQAAAQRNPFFPGRVAHGYLLLSFAAGLFVEPNEGPVLANTGLDHLRFMQPVEAGDSIAVRLTVKQKTPRNEEYGEVRWHVTLTNQHRERVAEYDLLTMNALAKSADAG